MNFLFYSNRTKPNMIKRKFGRYFTLNDRAGNNFNQICDYAIFIYVVL